MAQERAGTHKRAARTKAQEKPDPRARGPEDSCPGPWGFEHSACFGMLGTELDTREMAGLWLPIP